MAVLVPPGTFHATEADGPEPLELLCLFSPPVVPGSYEKKDRHDRRRAAPLPAGAVDAAEIARLEEIARRIRVEVVRAVNHARAGHLGGPLSAADMLAALYFHVLRIRPDEPDWPDRDRFILSKGHSSIGLYAAMALRGYFPVEELPTFDAASSRLQGHPDMTRLPGPRHVHRLARAWASPPRWAWRSGARLTGRDVRAYVMLGDGECQEGEVWEAAMAAARYGLDNLIAIVDHNKLQQYGWPGDGPDGRIPPQVPGRAGRASGRRSAGASSRWTATTCAAILDVPRARQSGAMDARSRSSPTRSRARASRSWRATTSGTRGPIEPEEFAIAMAELGEPLAGERGRAAMTLPMGRPMREVFGETVAELADDDPRIVMLDGDVGTSTRADIFEKAHPDRYLQMGIAEQNMLGVAAGLATMGLIPFISTFVSFAVVRPLDQIRVLIAQTGANVKITPGYAGLFTGQTGMSHIIVDDIVDHAGDAGHGHRLAGGRRRGGREVLRWAACLRGPVLRAARARRHASACSTTSYRFAFGQGGRRPRGPRRDAGQHGRPDARASWTRPSCSRPRASTPTSSTCRRSSRSTSTAIVAAADADRAA